MEIDKRLDDKFKQGFFGTLAASRRELKQVTSLFTPCEDRGAGTGKLRVGEGWVRARGWLGWSAHPLGGTVCRRHARFPPCAPGSSSWLLEVGFLVFLYLVHKLPREAVHAVIFSPLLLPILLLEERFVQIQALQRRVPGPTCLKATLFFF